MFIHMDHDDDIPKEDREAAKRITGKLLKSSFHCSDTHCVPEFPVGGICQEQLLLGSTDFILLGRIFCLLCCIYSFLGSFDVFGKCSLCTTKECKKAKNGQHMKNNGHIVTLLTSRQCRVCVPPNFVLSH